MKKIFILGIFYITLFPSYSKSTDFAQDRDKSEGVIDTAGIIFLFNGKEVSSKWAVEKLQKDEIRMYGAINPKEAIVYFGEKYRNGILICEIKEKETDE
jgi:hypothetical protein